MRRKSVKTPGCGLACQPFWFRSLGRLADVFISAELTDEWRLHLVYGKTDGKELLTLFTQRFASLSTMTTLLIGTQMGVLNSNSDPMKRTREALQEKYVDDIAFWVGLCLCLGIAIAISALVAILSAWSAIAVIDSRNAHIMLRSSPFLYAATLPARLALSSVYLFILWFNLYFYVVAAWEVALAMNIVFATLIIHVVISYSAVSRLIMHSGAIGSERILERDVEWELQPDELTATLLEKANLAKQAHIPPKEQYRIKYQEQLGILEGGGSLQFHDLRLPEEDYLGSDYGHGAYNQDD